MLSGMGCWFVYKLKMFKCSSIDAETNIDIRYKLKTGKEDVRVLLAWV